MVNTKPTTALLLDFTDWNIIAQRKRARVKFVFLTRRKKGNNLVLMTETVRTTWLPLIGQNQSLLAQRILIHSKTGFQLRRGVRLCGRRRVENRDHSMHTCTSTWMYGGRFTDRRRQPPSFIGERGKWCTVDGYGF